MAKAERIEIAIFPTATPTAMISELIIIGPIGGAPELVIPDDSIVE